MKNTFGSNLTVTLFGESHGDKIGVVLDGIAPGIKIDTEYIKNKLSLRKSLNSLSTKRQEPDEFSIVSGVFNGYTTGTPICVLIDNVDVKSGDYQALNVIPRPSHADYTASVKYCGFQDYRGGGHFSGRLTAPIVVAGAIVMQALESKGIYIGTHVKNLHGILDDDFNDYYNDIIRLSNKDFAVLSNDKEVEMKNEIEKAKLDGDSVGGVLESAIIGVPAGVGEPWFDSMESVLSHLLFSVPAVKGVEFGLGFDFSDKLGSTINDQFTITDGKVTTKTNNNGGINGGISNGMPIIIKTAIKPTPSIFKDQQSVNLETGENVMLKIKGRHDPAIIHRARVVVDSVLALGIADLLITKYGTDYLKG